MEGIKFKKTSFLKKQSCFIVASSLTILFNINSNISFAATNTPTIYETNISNKIDDFISEAKTLLINTNKANLKSMYSNIDLGNPKEVKEPLYVNNILLVNKDFALPDDFNPGNNKDMLKAFAEMKSSAKKDGITIDIGSSFRSYSYQSNLYNSYINSVGRNVANTFSAKPGHSEHQTGLTVDIIGSDKSTNINSKFDNTKEAKWLAENAYNFGFILRYPKSKEDITGYKYESWHYRYVGKDISKHFNNNDLTLEEYLGLG